MKKEAILAEIKASIPRLIKQEHDFRLEYGQAEYNEHIKLPRKAYFQLETNTLWMILYQHINWLAHFKFLKSEDVDKKIPKWLVETWNWPEEVAKAFWSCGRDPIAHTGNRTQMHSIHVNGIKYYIGLQMDEQSGWNGENGYYALSPMRSDVGDSPLPAQQYVFFYPNVQELLIKLVENITIKIETLDYNGIISLSAICRNFYFIKDDGSLFRMNDLLRIYKYAT